MSREHILEEIDSLDDKLTDLILEYWKQFAHFGTWQFWFNVVFFFVPLIFTLFFIDRKNIFRICFYGYSFHVMFVYLDVFLTRFNYWDHPYFMVPFIPVSIPVDGSFVPVAFMFAYQISTNRNRNFYILTFITSVLITTIAFVWHKLGLLLFYKGMNIFHVFLLDVGMSILAYWFTNLFVKLNQSVKS
ncbi:CBO0543 family protein [Metabacillus litoralis]|uniref:CBO0543 family protein n=1 Tax=Metabacillus litoralis TaxID=152268 RepID=UPI00203EA52D|nr:CBO0543 family protein [Metabacillus litoralis]MCM3409364.1 hypothetical protein [Metabacillus litoralis]